ncbi:MAG: type II toxin-antitoxin system CcdA family antitoxin [Pseudomonadota bacterium]
MPTRKTSLTMDADLLDEAKSYGINVSAAASAGVEKLVKEERTKRWQEENRDWVEAYNRWVEENGIPLSEYRTF